MVIVLFNSSPYSSSPTPISIVCVHTCVWLLEGDPSEFWAGYSDITTIRMCAFQVSLCSVTSREFVRTHTVLSPEFLARKFWDVVIEYLCFPHVLLGCWCNFTLRNTTLVGTCEGQRGAVSSEGHPIQAYGALPTKREGGAHATLANDLTLDTGMAGIWLCYPELFWLSLQL